MIFNCTDSHQDSRSYTSFHYRNLIFAVYLVLLIRFLYNFFLLPLKLKLQYGHNPQTWQTCALTILYHALKSMRWNLTTPYLVPGIPRTMQSVLKQFNEIIFNLLVRRFTEHTKTSWFQLNFCTKQFISSFIKKKVQANISSMYVAV